MSQGNSPTPAPEELADDRFEALVRTASDDPRRTALRVGVTVIASAFLFVYVSVVAGMVWLAAAMAIEAAGALVRARIRRGDRSIVPVYVAQVLIISLCWMVHAALLWLQPDLIARVAAIVDVFTIALYAAIGAHKDRRLLLALLTPALVTLVVLLVPTAWAQGNVAGALTATLATIGSCATLAGNALAMHRSDRNLSEAVRALALERADLERRVAARTAALAAALDEANAANATKARFLAALTHELRTPLNVVIGYAEILGDDLRSAPESAKPDDADRIAINARALLDLLNHALDEAAGAVPAEPNRADAA